MLTQYKNKEDLLLSKNATTAMRFDNKQLGLLTSDPLTPINVPDALMNNIELHVYAEDVWITGNHFVTNTKVPVIYDENKTAIQYKTTPIGINLRNELNQLKVTTGNFHIVVNFFENLIGDYNQQYLYVDQISPDRKEIRLRAITPGDAKFKQQVVKYIKGVNHTRESINITTPFILPKVGFATEDNFRFRRRNVKQYHETYLLNFSRNKCFKFINSVVIGEYLYVKLQDELPDEYEENLKCWVVKELRDPYFDRVSVTKPDILKTFNTLSGPNFNADSSNLTISTDTDFKTWTDLLGTSVQTSQQIVDSYFSGSLSGTPLNLNFSDFNNFVFYSSATERVKNFKFKLELLEYYSQQSASINLISGSTAINNAKEYETQRTNLISGFDAFEKFLYFESSSKLTTHDIPLESPNVSQLTGSYIIPVPKSNNTSPYSLYSINSTQFNNWYSGIIDSASLYDKLNNNSLVRAIPEFIRLDKSNENLDLFVNMLGHHYDILYMYINAMTKMHTREENPKLGMPNDLLFSVAKQFGWNLTDGNQYQDLWQYVYGTDKTGAPTTSSLSVNGTSMSGKDMTYSVWRRIVNNLPLLLKSKGTKRSIQALLSCYGIPQSMITIQEYGGPRLDRIPQYQKLNFDYALDLIDNSSGTVKVEYTQSLNINTIEVRFRTDNVVTNPSIPSTMNLFSIGDDNVTLDYTSGTLGTIQINGTSSANIEMFDGGWLTAMLRVTGSMLQVVAKRSKYGKIVAAVSASATASILTGNTGIYDSSIYGSSVYFTSGSLILGSINGGSRLKGQLQELRLWNSYLNDAAFDNHVKAPAAYNGNTDTYSELAFRLPLTQKINHNLTSSVSGVQPIFSGISASFTNWSSAEPYASVEETYYYDSVSVGTSTYDDNKVRIESNELSGVLSTTHRSEISEYDTAPADLNKLGVFFSPQTMINDDIIAHLGYVSYDEYIGDPGNDKYEYPLLKQKAVEYWKKYVDKNDFNAYIKIFTLFDMSFFQQLNQLLPARANKITGILIKPNLLERNRYNNLPTLTRTDEALETILPGVEVNVTGAYDDLSTEIITFSNDQISAINYLNSASVTLYDNDQLSAKSYTYSSSIHIHNNENISAEYDASVSIIDVYRNPPYQATVYKQTYAIWNGSTKKYTTGSTAYWKSEGVMTPVTKSKFSEVSYSSGSIQYLFSLYNTTATYGSTSSLYATLPYNITGKHSTKQDYLPKGKENSIYAGSKMTSPGFNINSPQTIDGGPVVEWTQTKGTQLIYQSNGLDGSLRIR